MSESRAYTAKEVEEMVISTVTEIAEEYANDTDLRTIDKCHGVAFSILAAFDGTRSGMPALDLVTRAGNSDQERAAQNNENWIPSGLVINADRKLHTHYDQIRREVAVALPVDVDDDDDGIPF